MMTTRDKLMTLLAQLPVAQSEYLHEGRIMVPPPMDAFADKIMALFASEDLFAQIMTASEAYVTRFGGTLTPIGALDKMQEEWNEFREATYVLGVDRGAFGGIMPVEWYESSSSAIRKMAAGELIDLLVTIGGVAHAMGLTMVDLEHAGHDTLNKLDARTPATHAWNPDTMTVERVGKVTP
jgi:hypothetical protein